MQQLILAVNSWPACIWRRCFHFYLVRRFMEVIFRFIFLNNWDRIKMVDILWAIFWNAFIQCKFSCFDPKYVPSDQMYSQWALVQMMAGRRTSDKLISEPMRPRLLIYICITKPQQVNQKTPRTWWYRLLPKVWIQLDMGSNSHESVFFPYRHI